MAKEQRRLGRRGAQGFTIIEVMVALLVLVVGLVGVIAMQIVAIQGNAVAREASEAIILAEHIHTTLQQDALAWTDSGTGATEYLKNLPTSAPTGGLPWIPWEGGSWLSPLGVPKSAVAIPRQRFCAAYQVMEPVSGSLITGFIRVYWSVDRSSALRENCGQVEPGDLDEAATAPPGIRFVTLPLSIKRQQ